MESAAHHVFSIFELAEMVVAALSPRDLMSMQRACPWFNQLIQKSHIIPFPLGRKAKKFLKHAGVTKPLTFEPVDFTKLEWKLEYQYPQDIMMRSQVIKLNPYLERIFSGWMTRRLMNGWMLISTLDPEPLHNYMGASWKSMLLTEPACTKIILQPAYMNWNYERWPYEVEHSEGWNWGQLWDYAHESDPRPNPDSTNIIENEDGITLRQFTREIHATGWRWFAIKML